MCKNVISNNYFETPCGSEGFILPEVISSSNCAAPMNVDDKSNLLQKHARNFIYAINLNETGYLKLFFLTEKIYEKNCFGKGLFLANLTFKMFFSNKKTERSPKLRFIAHNKCIEVILPGFCSSSLSHN